MRPQIQINAPAAARDGYRQLLSRDWTDSSLDANLAIIDDQLSKTQKLDVLAFDGTLFDTWERSSQPLQVNAVLVEILRTNEDLLGSAPPARLPAPQGKQLPKWFCRFVFSLTSLTLPARFRVEDESGLFLDCLSLLYLQAIHVLVPTIREKSRDHLNLLWHVMALHCMTAWQNNLTHQQFLLSCLFHEMRLRDREVAALRNSFSLTSPDEHDFLSKAQAVWSCLIEQNQLVEARSFILNAARLAPSAAVSELEEMLADTPSASKSA